MILPMLGRKRVADVSRADVARLHHARRATPTEANRALVTALLNSDGTVRSVEPLITGFLVDNKYLGRPVDMEWLKDGSMLLSDDF